MDKILKPKSSPWAWIPTLYVSEGLPYFAVNTLTVLMYSNMGVSKAQMAFFTGWLYLPWVIKPFWSPFIDLFRTKRFWILAMQLLICLAMASVAFFLTSQTFFATTLAAFWIMAFASATHDIAADGYYMLALDEQKQAAFVGVRSTFYRIASIVGQGGLVILAGKLEETLGNVPQAWSITFMTLSVFFALVFVYHLYALPHLHDDHPAYGTKAGDIAANFFRTFITFFKKPHIWSALAFMLLYRLPESLCIKMVQPFMKDPVSAGGLALSTSEIGFINGTIGVVSLLAGGIIGGIVIARYGLRNCLWPMAAALALPCAVYCYLAMALPDSYILISSLLGIEQFGYGFGFTAYMMYLMHFSKGESTTSHYAFCTAFMALGMMLPGMAAGWIYECFADSLFFQTVAVWDGMASPSGYVGFFWFVMLTTLATFVSVALVRRTIPQR